MAEKTQDDSSNWVERVGGNRPGTVFFQRIIALFGLGAAYRTLFFAAWSYAIFDKKASSALRDFRTHLGLTTSRFDLYKHFHSFGMTLIDRFAIFCGSGKKFRTTHVNEEIIAQQVARKKGVILLGGHVGNWEYAGNLLTKRIPVTLHIFKYEIDGAPEKTLSVPGIVVHYIQRGAADTAVEMVNALRNGDIVCLHGDRFFGAQRTIEHEFFGETARFPAGAMAIAAVTGAAIIPVFTVRTATYNYTFTAADPIYVPAGRDNRDENIGKAVGSFVGVLERICREYPHQWYNFFPFWEKADLAR